MSAIRSRENKREVARQSALHRLGVRFRKQGSSGNTGESCADFEEEVSVVTVAVGHTPEDLDLVADAFEGCSVERIAPSSFGRSFVQAAPADAKELLLRLVLVAVYTLRAEREFGHSGQYTSHDSTTIDAVLDLTQDLWMLRVDDYRFEVRGKATSEVLGVIGLKH